MKDSQGEKIREQRENENRETLWKKDRKRIWEDKSERESKRVKMRKWKDRRGREIKRESKMETACVREWEEPIEREAEDKIIYVNILSMSPSSSTILFYVLLPIYFIFFSRYESDRSSFECCSVYFSLTIGTDIYVCFGIERLRGRTTERKQEGRKEEKRREKERQERRREREVARRWYCNIL